MSIVILRPGAPLSGGPSRDRDSWLDALAKLIPGEAIVAFTAAIRLPGVAPTWAAHVAILLALTALAPLGLWWSARCTAAAAHTLQYAVRSVAFVLYGLGSDELLWQSVGAPSWLPQIAALVIPVLAAFVLCPPGAQSPPPHRIA